MGLYLQYGSYAHAEGEASITISKRVVEGETGLRTAFIETWTIEGWIHGDDVSEVTAALLEMESAYSVNGYDLCLYQPNGTATAHILQTARARGGVRITSLEYPDGQGAEYTTYRKYRIVAEAEFPTGQKGIKSFNETLTLSGGGPRFLFLQTLRGLPQKQLVAQSTPYRATQQGSAISDDGYPNIPSPLFPQHEHVDRRTLSRQSPKWRMGSLSNYGASWAYEFESSTPLVGSPNFIV